MNKIENFLYNKKNVYNSKTLGQLVDKYLIPAELEKKSNAEVSTPYKLRQEMLDKIPCSFWKGKKYCNKKRVKSIGDIRRCLNHVRVKVVL